jgi:hypothetical protein
LWCSLIAAGLAFNAIGCTNDDTASGKSLLGPGPAKGGKVVDGGDAWANEPAGFVSIGIDYDFSDTIAHVTPSPFGTSNWYGNAGSGLIDRVSDLTAPQSPSYVMQWFYPTGFAAGSSPGTVFNNVFSGPVSDYFVGYWFKYSDPFDYHPINTKQWYPYNSVADYFVVALPTGKMEIRVQSPDYSNGLPSTGGNYNLRGNVSDPTITLGVWHRFEHYFKRSSNGTTPDGIIRWWIDGVLCGNYTNVLWPTVTWEEWRFSPTWGGDGGTVAFDSYWWVDHVRLSVP